jgi:MoaA/NifB/PqqE/SkfB family radical SAM enzyme
LNEWNQENENVLRKYSPLLKELGVNKFDIKILGLPSANPNFIKGIFGNRQVRNVINIIGDNNFVNTGIIPKYNADQTDILAKLIEVIKVVEENHTINQSERKKYIEQLNQLTKEVLKEKDERLPKSIIDLILAGLGPLDSMTTIWLNVKEILKSLFE